MYQDIEMALATVIEFRGKGIEVNKLTSWDYSNDNTVLRIYEGTKYSEINGVAPDEYNSFLTLLTLAGVTVISYNPMSKSIARMDGVKAVTEFNENQREKERAKEAEEERKKRGSGTAAK